MQKELSRGPAQVRQTCAAGHKPGGTRLNVVFIGDSCGRKTDSAISQEVNDRYSMDLTSPGLDHEVTDW